jgi:hypothetical protein
LLERQSFELEDQMEKDEERQAQIQPGFQWSKVKAGLISKQDHHKWERQCPVCLKQPLLMDYQFSLKTLIEVLGKSTSLNHDINGLL